jgi:hypothetical protein
MGKPGDTRKKARSKRGDRVSGERLGAVSQMSAHSVRWTGSTFQRQERVEVVEKDA